jgi:RHS repeat-associated protein
MLRTLNTVSARTLTRNLRDRRRPHGLKPRTAKLRLDTLEAREQPGSVVSVGLAGAGMLEPLQVMAAVTGGAKLPLRAAAPVTAAQTPARPPLAFPLLASLLPTSAARAGAADHGSSAASNAVGEPASSAATPIDPSDLSLSDPAQFTVPSLSPASSGGAGATGGSTAGPAPSADAGQSNAGGQPTVVGTGPSEGEGGLSLTAETAGGAAAAPQLPALNRSVAAASAQQTTGERFVTPPNDTTPLEGPSAPRTRTVPVQTTANPIFAVGTDAGVAATVKVYDAQTRALKFTLSPFPNSFTGGVRVAVGDVTGDGTADVVVGQGPGGTNQVKVYNGSTGHALNGTLGGFSAFTSAQAQGVWIAAGDVTGDGKADLVVGADGNVAPKAKVFSGANGSLVRTMDLSPLGLTNGVRVAAADLNGDGKAEVIVGGGVGSPGRVAAYDGANSMALYDYFPFGADYRGGVTIAAGDIDADTYPDVIVGQASGGAQVKVFSGKDTASTWNLDAFPGTTGGVRVGAADADGDGRLDVLVGRGPSGGEVRAYASAGAGQVFSLTPFGSTFNKGTFVAGDARPVGGQVHALDSSDPTITVSTEDAAEGGVVTFHFTRDGDTSQGYPLFIGLGGTATHGTDYETTNSFFSGFPAGESTVDLSYDAYQDDLPEGPETIVVTVTGQGVDGVIPVLAQATAVIFDDDGPASAAPVALDIGPCVDKFGNPPGGTGSSNLLFRPGIDDPGTNVALPAYLPPEQDAWLTEALAAAGMLPPDAVRCAACPPLAGAWTNAAGQGAGATGNGRPFPDAPQVVEHENLVYILRCGQGEYFDPDGMGGYIARHAAGETLSHNSANKEYSLTDPTGRKFVFNDYDSTLPAAQRGYLKSETDPGGNTFETVTFDGSGRITAVEKPVTTGGTTTTTKAAYTYVAGKVDTITFTEQVGGGSPVTVRTADLTYYDGTTSDGTAGDLNMVVLKDPAGHPLETQYFRYWTTNSSTGYAGGLKFQVTGAAYERAAAWGAAQTPTPLSVDQMTDAQLAPFADLYLEYGAGNRVTRRDVGGSGCSACSGGIGSYTYAYETSPFADGYNSWRTKQTETRPDGSARVVYWNYAGEPVLAVHQEGGQEWATYFRYDTAGRLILAAAPSAVSGYDESYEDLLHNQSGDYQYLRNGQGDIATWSYYGSTTATTSAAGGAAGYLYQTAIQRGENGTSVLQGTTDYIARAVGSVTVYPVADATVYRNDNGTGGQTTSYAYTWNTGSLLPASMTVTPPTVTTGQNGPGTATSATVVMNGYGRPVWAKDAGGFITYTAYDDATWAVTKFIEDVDTTQTSTFSNLPSGWSTPSGGGLHLTTTYEIDDVGRATKIISPAGTVFYVVYKDDIHEMRVYSGWNSTNNLPTGPTQVYREDWARGYTEDLTMSAAPTVSSGRPTGTESISGVQSLSRQVLNSAGQAVYADEYFDLTGASYSQSSVMLGTSGTNYNRTQQDYDKLGRPNRTVTPTGTIHRTVYDGQGRVVSEWVGTDDTPTTGFWSPTNTAGTDLVKMVEYEYDAGSVGDGNPTKATAHPGGGAADRVTAMSYDWRNRQVATKGGVETSESTSLNRPITYAEYDNLSQVIALEAYDGDGLSITADANSDGVPDRPSSGALRAKATAAYDDLGRAYQERSFSVDPSSGSVSTNALTTSHWFDARGPEMKTNSPGGLVSKTKFDGAGRTTKAYMTDGGGDSAYADASTVTGDAVLEQAEVTYDADGNVLQATTRQRFHDETGTGDLGTPSTGVKARVSYAAGYYDRAGWPTALVDVGTNGGSAYTRPSSVPSRSDSALVTDYGYNAAGLLESTTDPKGLVSKSFYDLAGRVTKKVEDYVDGTVSDSDDKTVEYAYNGSGAQTTLSAKLTGGGQEVTENVYGVNTSGGLVSNDLVKEVRHPDPSTGSSSSTEKDSFTYDQLGEVLTRTDRNGNVHSYTYDVLGRVVADAVTTLGSGVDGTVRRIEMAYDGQGNVYLITSYDAATSGTVVNQVQREFNGLGQLTREWQAVRGVVNTSTTPSVRYAFSFAPSGSANNSRLTSITYPNGRVITYNYATGLADNISRLSSITDGSTTLESYDYLGLGTVVTRGHPQSGVDLTYVKLTGESDGPAGDKYTGLDAFGRVIEQRWTTSGGAAKDRRQYGYDRDSNRLYADNLVSSSNSELYTYDGLNQLSTFARGTLNGTKTGLTGSASRSQSWDFDALGNFDSQTTDGTAQTRTHNKQNEITAVSGATTPAYDSNGSLTTDETGRTFKYDAWNRLVEVRNSSNTLLATFRYDALGRRARETRGSTTTDLYYSSAWQVLEERVGSAVQSSYAWSPVYVDALIARDRDTNADGTLDERLYTVQDVNWDVVAILDTSGNVVERYAYDPYGGFAVLDGAWSTRATSSYAWTFQHQGLRWDADLGAYDDRGRILGPTLGRFFQTDPIGFAGGDADLYRYEAGWPTGGLDPSGLDAKDWLDPRRWQKLKRDTDEAIGRAIVGAAQDIAGAVQSFPARCEDGAKACGEFALDVGKKASRGDTHGVDVAKSAFAIGVIKDWLPPKWTGAQGQVAEHAGIWLDILVRPVDSANFDRGERAGPLLAVLSMLIPIPGLGEAEGACAASRLGRCRGANPRLFHLTGDRGLEGIGRSGLIRGEHGIYAIPESIAGLSPRGKSFRTGLPPSLTEHAVPIPQPATGLFSPVRPWGPISAWKCWGRNYYAPGGSINTSTGAFTRSSSFIGPRLFVYGPDVAFWSIVIGLPGGAWIYYFHLR